MKNKTFALKAAVAGVMLLGASMAAQAATATASVGVQLNSLAVGTCTVTPTAAGFALPGATVGNSLATYVAANFTGTSVAAGSFRTNAALNQTFNLACGSTTSITSMTIFPASGNATFPSVAFMKDSSGRGAFSSTTTPLSGVGMGAELVSINGAAAPFAFVALTAGVLPSYTTAFSVGTTAVPVVWRPALLSNGLAAIGSLVAPADQTGYTTDYVVTINY